MQCLPKSVVCVNSWSITMVSNTIYVMSVLHAMVCVVSVVCYVYAVYVCLCLGL